MYITHFKLEYILLSISKFLNSKSFSLFSVLNFLIADNFALGGYFNYTFIDKGSDSKEADDRTIGGQILVHF